MGVKRARRFDVLLVDMSGALGREIQKTRPCLVVSPDEMNRHLSFVLVAPLTTARRAFPTRVDCRFQERDGQIALDQVRSIDLKRVRARLGRVTEDEGRAALDVLRRMFAA